jgi:monovalent cation:H+ antiporter-2, CPA2 family
VITLPSRQDALAILNLIRTIAPQATKIVRSRHQLHTDEFVNAGANIVVGDEAEVSNAMAQTVQDQYQHAQEKNNRLAKVSLNGDSAAV